MIDIQEHILPGVDDGAKNWGQTLHMARLAVEDGITVMVATPHLYKGRSIDRAQLNTREMILQHVAQLKNRLYEEKIPLEILPG
jgi:protein-tyrosine phosphatase